MVYWDRDLVCIYIVDIYGYRSEIPGRVGIRPGLATRRWRCMRLLMVIRKGRIGCFWGWRGHRDPHGLHWECLAGSPDPPPLPPSPGAKLAKMHKVSFSALTRSAFVCRNVAF